MKKVYLLLLLTTFFLNSCLQIHYYKISNGSLYERKFKTKDKYGIEYSYRGYYFWVLNHTIISDIGIQIRNSSNKKIYFNTGKAQFESTNFKYRNMSSVYVDSISPGESHVFGLSFWGDINPPFSEGEVPAIPSNERAKLIIEGIEMDGKVIVMESIEFVPEVNVSK